ncbi:MAG: hypothetical protein WBQ69_06660, partial [Gallionella sp.]
MNDYFVTKRPSRLAIGASKLHWSAQKRDLENQVPDEFLQHYVDVAGAGDAGVLFPEDIALPLPSQAKTLPQTATPNTNKTATKVLFICNLLCHHLNTIRQFIAVHPDSALIS